MAYRRRSTSRNTSPSKRVRRSAGTTGSRWNSKRPVSRKRVGSKRRNTGRASRGVLQTLRIELAPGLSIGQAGGITRPNPTRRTRHF